VDLRLWLQKNCISGEFHLLKKSKAPRKFHFKSNPSKAWDKAKKDREWRARQPQTEAVEE